MNKKFLQFVFFALLSILILNCSGGKENLTQEEKAQTNILSFSVLDIDGKPVKLSDYRGKVLLIVNVASECTFTPQYEGLEKLYNEYRDKGFEILAFPCNDFMGQEPGSNKEIKQFCSLNYNVTFKLFDKITLEGEEKSDLFELLTNNPKTGESSVYWNFEKFLIDKNGYIIDRFRSFTKPESQSITKLIDELIN